MFVAIIQRASEKDISLIFFALLHLFVGRLAAFVAAKARKNFCPTTTATQIVEVASSFAQPRSKPQMHLKSKQNMSR